MSRPRTPARKRIGQVAFYEHHGGHWIYCRREGKPQRELIGATAAVAECVASLLNARLVAAAAGLSLGTMVAERLGDCLNPVTPSTTAILPPAHPLPAIAELRRRFLEHHERVLESSLHTVARYRTATLHLERFGEQEKYPPSMTP